MTYVQIEITRFVDDDGFPGIVECRLLDANSTTHLFVQKVPIVSAVHLGPDSIYPTAGVIACVVVGRRSVNGRTICTIDTEKPWGVASTTDTTRFEVFADQLQDLQA